MPTKTLVGHSVTALLRQAQSLIGADAVIIHVRRLRTAEGAVFEVTAADPASALAAPPRAPVGLGPGAELIAPPQPGAGPLVIALTGPTGAGKTTTIGKLLQHPRVFGTRRLGVIGLDTFRIGAVEQLRTYAALAGAPCHLVYDDDDVARARSALADRDVWLVDLPGRGPKQRIDRGHVEDLLQGIGPTEVHLVVPANLPEHLVHALAKESRAVRPTHLVISKLDEAPDESGAINAAADLGLPVRWVTDGQEVPFDLSSGESLLGAVRWSRPGPAAAVARSGR